MSEMKKGFITVLLSVLLSVLAAYGVVKAAKGTEVSWTVEKDSYWQGPEYHVFARVRAYAVDGSEEVLFSQPFMLVG